MASKLLDTTVEHTKYGRMCRMVVELCRDMLWELLTSKISVNDLPNRVQQNLHTLNRRLNNDQLQCIRKPGGQLPTNVDVDTTIIYQLLRSICPGIKKPTKGWGSDPDKSDLEVGDDIERIRLKRNLLYGHAKEARLYEATYTQEVEDLRAIASRLDTHLQRTPPFTQVLTEMEECSMDIEKENEYIEQLRALQEREDEMMRRVGKVEGKVEKLEVTSREQEDTKKEIKESQAHLTDQVEKLKETACIQKETNTEIKSSLTDNAEKLEEISREHEDSQKEIKESQVQLTDEVEKLKETACIQEDSQKEIKESQVQLTDEVEKLKKTACIQEDSQKEIKESQVQLTDEVEKLKETACIQGETNTEIKESLTDNAEKLEEISREHEDSQKEIKESQVQLTDKVEKLKETACIQEETNKEIKESQAHLTDKVEKLNETVETLKEISQTQEGKYTFIQTVLDKCRVSIVESEIDKHSAGKILDVFREEGSFGEITHRKVRDLKDTLENKTTSDCLGALCDVLRRKPNCYVKLKSALARTGQEKLLKTIETIETAYHDELKGQNLHGCMYTADRRCPLQDRLKCPEGLPPFELSKVEALQQYLIALYQDDCEWKNPMPVETDQIITILEMYARPSIKLIRQKGEIVNPTEEQQRQRDTEPVSLNYKNIFTTKTEKCRNIYITGNAGMGKTTFCKKLVFSWCKAVQNISEEGDSAEDLSVLREFRLLFYVNLREAESLYHVEDMIRENVLHNAPTEYNVSDIIKTEKCLVVLDGLDEWSCPQGARICRGLNKDIPGRNTMNKTCVYVTATRNWKFCVADMEWSKDYDKQVELCGIDKKTSEDFARKVVGHLNSKSASAISRPVSGFFQEVEQKKLDSLTTVPILLIQLLTLWYFCKDLGKSQVQLYCRMLDLLLKQARKHLSEETSTENQPVATDTTLPECFDKEDNCQTYTQLLLCLSKLAFMSLLNKEKEESLIFSWKRLREFKIVPSDIDLCLKFGIFTQDKGFCYPLREFKKYSFLHKKLQEFLAAVYLVTSHDVDQNMGQVREYCDKLDTTLEMSQVIMFVCGMNAQVGSQLLEHLRDVVEGDNSVQNSRQSLGGRRLIESIQTSVMACVAEGASNGITIDVHLQDYYIDSDTISDYIEHVVEKKNTSIKSVYIDIDKCSTEHVTVVLQHLQKVQRLEKLWLQDLSDVSDISMLAPVLTTNVGTLQSLCLLGADLAHHEALFTAVLGCVPSLRALQLGSCVEERWDMVASHGQIEQLITLGHFGRDLGKSQVQLYCKMLDLLLEQAKKHLTEKTSTVTKPVQTDAELPGCFSEEEDNCHNHTQLLLCLSKLAFMSLLNKKKEDSLVFKSSRLEVCGIDSSDISLCLKCGIFTQTNFFGNPIGRYKKYSFIHKKLQEFLAAVYLVTSHDVEKNIGQVREYCDKLDTTLEMGQMYMFVCGMNAEVGNKLLEHLTSVVEGDNSVQNSRQSVVGRNLIEGMQTSVMACVTEGASYGLTIDVHLQDYYILDKNTITDYINHVVEKKNTSIKSVYINTLGCSKEPVTVVFKHLQKVQTLEKFWLLDPFDAVSDLSMLASVLTTNVGTLQSLCLGDVNLAYHKALFAAVLGCVPSLRVLALGWDSGDRWGMVVSHGQKEQLLAATSHLTHLGLYLYCTDHGWECRPVLDLSGHTQLQTLNLRSMCVTNLHAVAHSVEKVDLSFVTVAHSTLRKFIEALAQSPNKVQVYLWNVTVTEHSGEAADTAAYIRDCDRFTVERCKIWSDKRWAVKFHKK